MVQTVYLTALHNDAFPPVLRRFHPGGINRNARPFQGNYSGHGACSAGHTAKHRFPLEINARQQHSTGIQDF